MRQYVKFTATMWVDDDPLNWDDARGVVRSGLRYGDRHQDWALTLDRVIEIGLDEEE